MTGSSRGIDNFVIKNGEVEGKAEPDRVCRLHFRLRNVKRLLVRLLRILDYRCKCKSASIQITSFTTSFLRRDHRSNKLSLSERNARREKTNESWIKGGKTQANFNDSPRVCPTKTARVVLFGTSSALNGPCP